MHGHGEDVGDVDDAIRHQVEASVVGSAQEDGVREDFVDVALGEDACLVAQGQTPRTLAFLNNAALFLIDSAGGVSNTARLKFMSLPPALSPPLTSSSTLPDFFE